MADNTQINSNTTSGDTIATDDISGVKYPRSKIVIGDDGTNDGDVSSSNPMPVSGTVTANLGATDNAVLDQIAAAVEIMDDWDESDRAKVNILAGNEQPSSGSDVIDSGTLRVTMATNDGVASDIGNVAEAAATVDSIFGGVTPRVLVAGAMRDDALSSLTPVEGDVVQLRVGSTGALWTAIEGTVTVDLGANNDVTLATLPDTSAGDLAAINTAVSGTVSVDLGANNDVTIDGSSIVQAEDAAHQSGDAGVMMLFVRQDSQSDFGADGDYVPGSIDDAGNLRVNVAAGGGSGGTSVTDDDDFTAGSTSLTPVGGVYQSSPTNTTDGDFATARMTQTGAMHVSVQEVVSGGGTQYTLGDDTYTEATSVGTLMGAVRNDTLAALAGTDNEIAPFQVNSDGALYVAIASGSSSGTEATHDSAVAADGPQIMCEAADFDGSALPNAVGAEGDAVRPKASLNGVPYVMLVSEDGAAQGTVTAELSSVDNAVLDAIAASVSTVAGAVSTQMQVDIVADGAGLLTSSNFAAAFGTAGSADSQVMSVQGIASMTPLLVDATGQGDIPITLDSEEVTVNLGTVDNAVLDAIAASVATVAGAVSTEMQVDVVGSLPAGTNNIGDVDIASFPAEISGPGSMPVVDSYTNVAVTLSADTANQEIIAAPGANKQIWVYGGLITADTAAGTIAFQDEDDTAATGAIDLAAVGGGFTIGSPSGNFNMPVWKLASNKALEADTVTAGANGWLSYAIVDVS